MGENVVVLKVGCAGGGITTPSPEPSPSRGEGIAGVNAFLGASRLRGTQPEGRDGGEKGESRI